MKTLRAVIARLTFRPYYAEFRLHETGEPTRVLVLNAPDGAGAQDVQFANGNTYPAFPKELTGLP